MTPLPLPPAINIECLCLCIHLTRRTKMNVIVGYRAPSSPPEPFFTQLDEVVSHVQGHSNTPLCVLGDFNAKHSDWLPSQSTTAAGKHAMDFCITNNLVQTVTEPTYGLHTSHPSTLDLILLNKPHLLDHCYVLPPVADHCPTLANLRLTGQRHCQPVSYSTWNYENMDSTGLHDALSSIDWSPVLNCECVDTATERWSSLFLSKVSDYVPKVLHTSRSKGTPWYSAFLHRLSRVRDRLFQRWKCQPNNSSRRESYCRVRNWYMFQNYVLLNNNSIGQYQILSVHPGHLPTAGGRRSNQCAASPHWTKFPLFHQEQQYTSHPSRKRKSSTQPLPGSAVLQLKPTVPL